MKKILDWLKHWFEHNGMIKILVAFAILIIAVAIGRNIEQAETICGWTAMISGGYLVLTVIIFTIAGIVNAIKDRKNVDKDKEG
jgi:uncharacterized membrane protein